MATDFNPSATVHFYFFNGATLIRTNCPAGVIVRDRTVCADEPFQVETYEQLRDELEAEIGASVPQVQTRIEQRFARIQQIDFLIIEHLSDVDDLADQIDQLRAEMARREGDLADLKTVASDIKLQILAIQDQIRQRPDPDLYLLLEDLKKKLADNDRAVSIAARELAQVRERFITVNAGLITDSNYRSLVAQRAGHVDALDRDRGILESILLDVSSVRQVFSFVLRPLVTYDVIRTEPGYEDIKRQIGRFERKFAAFAAAPINAGMQSLDAEIAAHRQQIYALQNEHAAEVRLRTTLEQGIGHTFFDKIAVEVSPQGGGQGTVVFEDVVLRRGVAASGDAAIDKMIADLDGVTENKFSGFLTQSRCVTFFTSELTQMIRVAASLQARDRIGTGYIYKATNGNGWDCDTMVGVATSWKIYREKGGHIRSRQVAQLHQTNLGTVRTIEQALAILVGKQRELARRLDILAKDQAD
jgi:hypothetical protein